MTTSLREEIYEYLGNDKIATDEIISILEKRIDELLQDESNIYCPKCNDVSVEVFRDLLK